MAETEETNPWSDYYAAVARFEKTVEETERRMNGTQSNVELAGGHNLKVGDTFTFQGRTGIVEAVHTQSNNFDFPRHRITVRWYENTPQETTQVDPGQLVKSALLQQETEKEMRKMEMSDLFYVAGLKHPTIYQKILKPGRSIFDPPGESSYAPVRVVKLDGATPESVKVMAKGRVFYAKLVNLYWENTVERESFLPPISPHTLKRPKRYKPPSERIITKAVGSAREFLIYTHSPLRWDIYFLVEAEGKLVGVSTSGRGNPITFQMNYLLDRRVCFCLGDYSDLEVYEQTRFSGWGKRKHRQRKTTE